MCQLYLQWQGEIFSLKENLDLADFSLTLKNQAIVFIHLFYFSKFNQQWDKGGLNSFAKIIAQCAAHTSVNENGQFELTNPDLKNLELPTETPKIPPLLDDQTTIDFLNTQFSSDNGNVTPADLFKLAGIPAFQLWFTIFCRAQRDGFSLKEQKFKMKMGQNILIQNIPCGYITDLFRVAIDLKTPNPNSGRETYETSIEGLAKFSEIEGLLKQNSIYDCQLRTIRRLRIVFVYEFTMLGHDKMTPAKDFGANFWRKREVIVPATGQASPMSNWLIGDIEYNVPENPSAGTVFSTAYHDNKGDKYARTHTISIDLINCDNLPSSIAFYEQEFARNDETAKLTVLSIENKHVYAATYPDRCIVEFPSMLQWKLKNDKIGDEKRYDLPNDVDLSDIHQIFRIFGHVGDSSWGDSALKPPFLSAHFDKTKPYIPSTAIVSGEYTKPVKCYLSSIPACFTLRDNGTTASESEIVIEPFECAVEDTNSEEYKECVLKHWERNHDAIIEDVRAKSIAATAQLLNSVKACIVGKKIRCLFKVKWQGVWGAKKTELRFRPVVEHIYPFAVDSSILPNATVRESYDDDYDDVGQSYDDNNNNNNNSRKRQGNNEEYSNAKRQPQRGNGAMKRY